MQAHYFTYFVIVYDFIYVMLRSFLYRFPRQSYLFVFSADFLSILIVTFFIFPVMFCRNLMVILDNASAK